MRDENRRCGRCGAPLPRSGRGRARLFCSPAHRQAAYRMRAAARRSPATRRGAAARIAPQRRAMRDAAAVLATTAAALRAQISQGWLYRAAVLPPGGHATAAAGLADLEAAAVAADRAAGATWAQVGAALGLSADAARKHWAN